ncbi:alpha,alpha-trehalase [Pumilibacter muris]|uniref:alpha,alpha-trehalase n=1 Tax=Pumilibacter muris TaxID=2941510 RepID=UPI00203DEB0F|nr:alpha,alpha-trehalase [Pumilibacter muris]
MTVQEYIREKMPLTLRLNVKDNDTLFGLPYPYTVPCAEHCFNELYYWDTYFTNKALFALGQTEQTANNVKNILYLIERFGYMPNGSRAYFLKRSQPPYAALMADDVYKATGDLSFLKTAFVTLKKEYEFWMTKRVSENGLNHYDCEEDDESCAEFYNGCVAERVGKDEKRDPKEAGRHYFAEAESGWDFNPRFSGYCAEYNAVDLNSNLYLYEKLFAEYEVLLGEGDGKEWTAKAKSRAEKMNELMWNSASGVYKDYNYKTGELSGIISAASFQPYFVDLATEQQKSGLLKLLQALESDWGIFTTEKVEKKYQWAYPNIWAPCQYIAVEGLRRYGYAEEAERIAKKYIALLEKNFAAHGKLFEKYNGVTGNIDAVSEYGTPEMLGWTAGVYCALSNL